MVFYYKKKKGIDDVFFNRNWAGVCLGSLGQTRIGVGQVHRLCVVSPGCDCYCADRSALNVALLCKKNKKKGGSARASHVTAPMPKSDSSDCFKSLASQNVCMSFCVPFTDGVTLYL